MLQKPRRKISRAGFWSSKSSAAEMKRKVGAETGLLHTMI